MSTSISQIIASATTQRCAAGNVEIVSPLVPGCILDFWITNSGRTRLVISDETGIVRDAYITYRRSIERMHDLDNRRTNEQCEINCAGLSDIDHESAMVAAFGGAT